MNTPKANAVLVEALGSSLRRGDHALGTVPDLLKRILHEEAWREFVTQRGELVEHARFQDFVATPPLKGLGASMDLIDRIVGTDDLELLSLLRSAKSPGQGARTDLVLGEDSPPSRALPKGEDSALTVMRLAAHAPDEFEAVRRGEKTIHAAAVAAGLRRRRVPVRLDSAESAAKTIRRYMNPDQLQALVRLLSQEESPTQ